MNIPLRRTAAMSIAVAAAVILVLALAAQALTGQPRDTLLTAASSDIDDEPHTPSDGARTPTATPETTEDPTERPSPQGSPAPVTPTATPAPTPTVDDEPTAVNFAPADAAPRTFLAGEAGSVTYRVTDGSFELLEASPASRWTVKVERASGHELDLDFFRGTVRVKVDVEFEDGSVRERVRVRDEADDDSDDDSGDDDSGDDDSGDDDSDEDDSDEDDSDEDDD